MKLFKTNNIDVVKSCQLYFGFSLPSEKWTKRATNLDAKYILLVKKRLCIIVVVQCCIDCDYVMYIGVYVTVLSILCPLSSFSFFLVCLVAIIFDE